MHNDGEKRDTNDEIEKKRAWILEQVEKTAAVNILLLERVVAAICG